MSQKASSMNNNIAIAYLRVSTKKQKEDGVSLEVQKEKAIEYAKKNGLNLELRNIREEIKPASKVHNDNYYGDNFFDSTYDLNYSLKNRPVLLEILLLAESKKIQHLIVYSTSRLARNLEESFAIQALLHRHGVELHYTDEKANISTRDEKIGQFLKTIYSAFDELEADLISKRVKLGNMQCAKDGHWPGGTPPLGFINTPVPGNKRRKELKIDTSESYLVKEIFKYYNSYGYTYDEIATKMNALHPRDNPWTKGSIESILTNILYTGLIAYDREGGWRNPGKRSEPFINEHIRNPAIIDDETFETAARLRTKKSNKSDPRYLNTPYLLKGKLVCGICGEIMKTRNYNDYEVYRCEAKNTDISDSNNENIKRSHFHMVIKKKHRDAFPKRVIVYYRKSRFR